MLSVEPGHSFVNSAGCHLQCLESSPPPLPGFRTQIQNTTYGRTLGGVWVRFWVFLGAKFMALKAVYRRHSTQGLPLPPPIPRVTQ